MSPRGTPATIIDAYAEPVAEPHSAPVPPPPGGTGELTPAPTGEVPGRPTPLDPPMVPFAVAGLVGWSAVGLVLLVFFRDWLARHGHTDWLWICLAGVAIGLVGLATMLRHDAHRRRRRAGH